MLETHFVAFCAIFWQGSLTCRNSHVYQAEQQAGLAFTTPPTPIFLLLSTATVVGGHCELSALRTHLSELDLGFHLAENEQDVYALVAKIIGLKKLHVRRTEMIQNKEKLLTGKKIKTRDTT